MEDFLNLHARQALNAPAEWQWCKAEVVGDNEPKMMQVTGAVYPRKRNGEPNYRKPLPGTLKVACFSTKEHEAFVAEWEKSTGKCSKCSGTGCMPAGWSAVDGTKFARCSKCDGKGKAQQS